MRIKGSSNGYVVEYPQALEYEEKQQDISWTAKEIAVEEDINDLKVNATPAERHGILEVLKLFVQYELIAGNEYWGDRFKKMYPRVEFQRLGTQFSQTELCVHAPFYNKINEVLHLNTPEFYNSWKEDETLKERMYFIDKYVSSKKHHGLLSLAVFSLVEGAILYSSFAFLKSFKKQGKNLIPQIVSGINFSVRDENLHSEAGAWVFLETCKELGIKGDRLEEIEDDVRRAAKLLFSHETHIIKNIFKKGSIEGISPEYLENFVKHRIDVCLNQLGMKPLFSIVDDFSWFYDDIAGAKATDHFVTLSSNYSRHWSEGEFNW